MIHSRRKSDLDPDYAIIGVCLKTLGKTFNGGTLIYRTKHTSVAIVDKERISNHIKSPLLKSMVEQIDYFNDVK